MPQKIPIKQNVPSQSFKLQLDSVLFSFLAKWNTRNATWTLDMTNEATGERVLGLWLKAGTDIINGYNLGAGSMYCVDLTGNSLEMSLENAGIEVILVHYSEGE